MRSLIISTKGGAGKSTFCFEILAPFLYEKSNKKAKIYEYDSENQESLNYANSSIIDAKIMATSNDEAIGDDLSSKVKEKEYIVDVGGGSRAGSFILNNGDFFSGWFDRIFIPLNFDLQDTVNAITTYQSIVEKGFNKDNIIFVCSQAIYDEEAENKNMFVPFFGSDFIPKSKGGYGFDGYAKAHLGENFQYVFVPYNQYKYWAKLQGKTAYELIQDLSKFKTMFDSGKPEDMRVAQKNIRLIRGIDIWQKRVQDMVYSKLEQIYV